MFRGIPISLSHGHTLTNPGLGLNLYNNFKISFKSNSSSSNKKTKNNVTIKSGKIVEKKTKSKCLPGLKCNIL